ARGQRPADPPTTAVTLGPPAADRSPAAGEPAPRTPAPADLPVSPPATRDAEPAAVVLPRKTGRGARLAGAYRALRDATAQSNGLPAPPAMTRARQAWRRSEYLGTLTRGIAEPELTQ